MNTFLGVSYGDQKAKEGFYKEVCEMVLNRFYNDTNLLYGWYDHCLRKSGDLAWFMSDEELLKEIQDHLNIMDISHLEIFTVEEDARVWHGVAKENGVLLRGLNDHFFVVDVIKGGPADKAGFKLGDEILTLNGEEIHSMWDIIHFNGSGTLKRIENGVEKNIVFILVPEIVSVSYEPVISRVSKDTGLIKITSFRLDLFKTPNWKKTINKMNSYEKLVIDLRNNTGGSFVAALRALSPFFCSVPTEIGKLYKPRMRSQLNYEFKDGDNELEQFEAFKAYETVSLKTFEGYGCYKGRVTILMNNQTASVSEIFSKSLEKRKNVRLFGTNSSGSVVLSVWYWIKFHKKKYSISIPEANFISYDNSVLEGVGLTPSKDLFYEHEDLSNGVDTWVKEAIN